MGICYCIKKCTVGETYYLLTTKHTKIPYMYKLPPASNCSLKTIHIAIWLPNSIVPFSPQYRVMHVGHSHIVTEYVLCNISGERVKLTEIDQEKDVGVWVSSNLKSSLHCTKAVASVIYIRMSSLSSYLFLFTRHI